MTEERLRGFERRGWRLTRDGSTSTALLAWDDPDDPEGGWEILVLRTEGHASRLTLAEAGSGLTERSAADARRLLDALTCAMQLLEEWKGELLEEE
jgi:hypothetical protein